MYKKQPKATTDQIFTVLAYTGCTNLRDSFTKLHFWTFVNSLALTLHYKGKLSEKQYDALVSIIETRTASTCISYKLASVATYSAERVASAETKRVSVVHNFDNYSVINTVDLPYAEDEQKVVTFHPYNDHSVMIEDNKRFYKVPKPLHMGKITRPTTATFKYHRTTHKGFLQNILIKG
jgi:hypothetical protein